MTRKELKTTADKYWLSRKTYDIPFVQITEAYIAGFLAARDKCAEACNEVFKVWESSCEAGYPHDGQVQGALACEVKIKRLGEEEAE